MPPIRNPTATPAVVHALIAAVTTSEKPSSCETECRLMVWL